MRNASQFRVLYRQFLFRMVDLELLSADARGDLTKLFGQFAALMVFLSLGLAWAGGALARIEMSPSFRLAAEWNGIHSLIATTMLVVGLFGVMTWESTFPDRRDVLVLSALPIRSRTMFLARIAAVATAAGVTVLTLHCLAGVVWSICLNNTHKATLAPSTSFNAALPPISLTALEPVLKGDLAGATMPRNVSVAVWRGSEERVFSYGSATAESVYSIGSIRRTFTALALTQMVKEGKALLKERVRELMPSANSFEFVGAAASGDSEEEFDVLGRALANRAGMTYPMLVESIARGFGMHHTTADDEGVIRSTARDMLRFLHSQPMPKMRMPLVWNHDPVTGTFGHYSGASNVLYIPNRDYAVVVLTDATPELYPFSQVLTRHIGQRLAGERATSFSSVIVPASGGTYIGLLRLFAAWWLVMIVCGAFTYCSMLGAQGLAARLLPRRLFLRISSWMQMAAFAMLPAAYFLQPAYSLWSPSYWFLGLFEQLSGSPALPGFAVRAWVAMPIVFSVTALVYTAAYFQTIRRIVEEPDIAGSSSGWNWLPHFGSGFATAVGQFSIRTLLRSRQHRLLMAFYVGVGFAMTILFQRMDEAVGALCSSITMMALFVLGLRVAFSLPISMKANWIFQTTPGVDGRQRMIARRRTFYALSVAPVCIGTALLMLFVAPWQDVAKHVLLLAMFGSGMAEMCLRGTQKLPFTCSYLPGKSRINVAVVVSGLLILPMIVWVAEIEHDLFANARGYAFAAGVMLVVTAGARIATAKLAASEEGTLRFEQVEEPVVIALRLT